MKKRSARQKAKAITINNRGPGIRTADGKWQTAHDLRCLEIMGCKMEKAFGGVMG